MGYTKDDGIDIVAIRKLEPGVDVYMLVQCKTFAPSRKIGVELVKESWAPKAEHSFDLAMLATTSNFTGSALRKADLWKLALRDYDAISRVSTTTRDGLGRLLSPFQRRAVAGASLSSAPASQIAR